MEIKEILHHNFICRMVLGVEFTAHGGEMIKKRRLALFRPTLSNAHRTIV